MDTKHTPGPWAATKHSWSRIGIYAEGEAVAALDIYDDATEDNQAELEERMEANALLIAAAPDLLDALTELERQADLSLDYRPEFRRAIADAHAAIVKATGSAK